jgi:hypothetical protein
MNATGTIHPSGDERSRERTTSRERDAHPVHAGPRVDEAVRNGACLGGTAHAVKSPTHGDPSKPYALVTNRVDVAPGRGRKLGGV